MRCRQRQKLPALTPDVFLFGFSKPPSNFLVGDAVISLRVTKKLVRQLWISMRIYSPQPDVVA